MNLRITFKIEDCKLQFYEKRRLFSYFSVNPRTPASCWRRLLKLKRKKKTLLRLSLASLSPHHYSQQQRSPFRLFITRQKLSNALKSLKSKKILQESTNRASAFLQIISTTRSCACAQFTSYKRKKHHSLDRFPNGNIVFLHFKHVLICSLVVSNGPWKNTGCSVLVHISEESNS